MRGGSTDNKRISKSTARKMGEKLPSQTLFWKDWKERINRLYVDQL